MWATLDPSSRCPDTCHSLGPAAPARMLLPLLLLPWAWGARAASLTLRLLQINVFHNASSADMEGMALVGDLETHSMDCSTCKIRFRQRWAQQGLKPKQWQDLELLLHRYLSDFIRLVNKVVKDQGEGYPFVTQVFFSCELDPNGTLRRVCDAAVDGEDFISFDLDTGKWVTRQGDQLGIYVEYLVNQDKSLSTLFPFLERTMCVYGLNTFAQYGKESLERQAFPPVPPGFVTLRVLLTSRFHNASSADMELMALLGDLETHSLDCSTCQIRFLQPWAQRGLTPKQWQDVELLIHRSLSDFILTVTRIAQQQGMGYPFVTQASLGCELHPNGTSRGFYDAAGNGEGVVSFEVDVGTWVARSEDKLALHARDLLNWDKSASARLQVFFRITCIYLLRTFVAYGKVKESLERQAGIPAPLLLVCRVTGFYPRPIRVAWLPDGEEVGPGWRLNSSGILPNADLTYQLRSSLAVGPGDGHSYACRVEHSSLGGQSLLIPWEQGRGWVSGLVVGITLGALAVAAMAVVLWWSRHRVYQDVRPGESRA
ncbi:Antigen-presenting glycoprotein CD1d2 [Chelonia mydas]|uniref:Antigen-presenting glycoprotein CD1d2 n=1 Tax=Chelonia mydas TaxID=8469 RepID=M7BZ35_CHEMY|nr:Antigen-presenting glycoprotein CD1d2 [Chelonia mydas]